MTVTNPPRTNTLALVGFIASFMIFFIVWLSLFSAALSQTPIFN